MCLILKFLDNRWEKFKYCTWNSAWLRTADLHCEIQHAGSTMSPSRCQLWHLNSSEKYIGVSRPVRIWKKLFLYDYKGSFIVAVVCKSCACYVFYVFQHFSVLFKQIPYIEQVICSLCRWKRKDKGESQLSLKPIPFAPQFCKERM